MLDWGIDIILWLQKGSPSLDLPFIALTFLGNEGFFIVLIPLVYWCYDRRTGVGLAVLFLISVYFNEAAKVIAAQPRPFTYDPRVMQIVSATSGGFPSGHTQQAVVVWGYLAFRLKKTWAWIVAGMLMALIPLSRVYLGVHFPTDLVGGYLMGGIWLVLYVRFESSLETVIARRNHIGQLCWALILPIVLVLIFPNCSKNALTAMGTLMGMGAGFALERRWIAFAAGGVWWTRILRFIVGIAIVVVLKFGLGKAFSGLEAPAFFRFVRYAVIGFWAGFGAPLVFCKLKIDGVLKSPIYCVVIFFQILGILHVWPRF